MNKKTLFLFFFPLSFLDMKIINIQRIMSWPARKPFCRVRDKANGRRLKGFQSAYSRASRLGLLKLELIKNDLGLISQNIQCE